MSLYARYIVYPQAEGRCFGHPRQNCAFWKRLGNRKQLPMPIPKASHHTQSNHLGNFEVERFVDNHNCKYSIDCNF